MSDSGHRGPSGDTDALVLERFVPYRLAVLADGVSRALAETYAARFGISIPEWRVLAHLGRQEPLSAGELSSRTRMEKPRVTRALQRMLRKGLIEREASPDDHRVAVIRMSARGIDLYRRIVPLAREREEALLADLSAEERAALHRLLDRLEERVARLGSGGGG